MSIGVATATLAMVGMGTAAVSAAPAAHSATATPKVAAAGCRAWTDGGREAFARCDRDPGGSWRLVAKCVPTWSYGDWRTGAGSDHITCLFGVTGAYIDTSS